MNRVRRRLAAWWKDLLVVVLAGAIDLYVYAGDSELRWGGQAPGWLVPLLTVVVLGTLLLRWERPVAVFLLQWLYALAGLLLPQYAPFAGLLVALHAVACQVGLRLSLGLLASCAVPFAVHNYNAAVDSGSAVGATVATLSAVWMVVTAAVWAVGRRTYVVDRRASLIEEIHVRRAAEAVRAERLQLARDLHDIVAHAVSAMILQAAGARTLVGSNDDRVRGAFTAIESAGVQAMEELHRLLGLLRAVDPEGAGPDVAAQPGLDDVPALVALSREAGLDVRVDEEGNRAVLDRSVDLAAYRVVQEALANAAKHAGPGALVRIRLTWTRGSLLITARSTAGLSPRPAEVPSAGLGLQGLAERVALVGGRLQCGPEGNGFLLTAELAVSRVPAGPVTAADSR